MYPWWWLPALPALPICFLLLSLLPCCCSNDKSETLGSYVVLVSFDGFRWDYSSMYDTPNFNDLASSGVSATRLIPSFPTKTFPNHYTLATGLYPDHHGIINNSFYIQDLRKVYRISDRDMVTNKDAYLGEPIWVTAEKQGIRSACFYWVGSEAPVMDTYPSFWEKYDGSVPYEDRVDQVIAWLKLPVGERPGLVTLYFDEPDGIGHKHGPESEYTKNTVKYLDSVLGYLRSELSKLAYADRVNLIVLSDHGMGPISRERYVNLFAYLKEGWTERVVGGNPVYLIEPAEGFADTVTAVLDALDGVQAWQKEDIPPRLHYGTSDRFPGIVVVADSFWSIGTKPDPSGYSGGTHGYDNAFSDMHTIFMAEGPAFKSGYCRPPFENVEVYGIIAHILGLDPVETDGNLDNVLDLFQEN
jgi:predicted AlkP superfamily pyrophosphatase or phosphodiesterase